MRSGYTATVECNNCKSRVCGSCVKKDRTCHNSSGGAERASSSTSGKGQTTSVQRQQQPANFSHQRPVDAAYHEFMNQYFKKNTGAPYFEHVSLTNLAKFIHAYSQACPDNKFKLVNRDGQKEIAVQLILDRGAYQESRKAMQAVYAEPYNLVDTLTNQSVRIELYKVCLLYTSPSPRDRSLSRMPSSA